VIAFPQPVRPTATQSRRNRAHHRTIIVHPHGHGTPSAPYARGAVAAIGTTRRIEQSPHRLTESDSESTN
jgi:hypothetical protein